MHVLGPDPPQGLLPRRGVHLDDRLLFCGAQLGTYCVGGLPGPRRIVQSAHSKPTLRFHFGQSARRWNQVGEGAVQIRAACQRDGLPKVALVCDEPQGLDVHAHGADRCWFGRAQEREPLRCRRFDEFEHQLCELARGAYGFRAFAQVVAEPSFEVECRGGVVDAAQVGGGRGGGVQPAQFVHDPRFQAGDRAVGSSVVSALPAQRGDGREHVLEPGGGGRLGPVQRAHGRVDPLQGAGAGGVGELRQRDPVPDHVGGPVRAGAAPQRSPVERWEQRAQVPGELLGPAAIRVWRLPQVRRDQVDGLPGQRETLDRAAGFAHGQREAAPVLLYESGRLLERPVLGFVLTRGRALVQ